MHLQVNGKVNSIMLDNCKKVGVVFESVVACFEAVNCSGLQVQVTTSCPSLNIDKTDGAQVRCSARPCSACAARGNWSYDARCCPAAQLTASLR